MRTVKTRKAENDDLIMSTFAEGWWSCFRHVVKVSELKDFALIRILKDAGYNKQQIEFYKNQLSKGSEHEVLDNATQRMLSVMNRYLKMLVDAKD